MDKEEIGLIVYYIFITMCAIKLLSLILDVDIAAAQCIEFMIALILYHLLIRTMLYKTFFSSKKTDDKDRWLHPKENPLPFIFYAIISIAVSAFVMYLFNINLDSNIQGVLEILAICFYQYLLTRLINTPTI